MTRAQGGPKATRSWQARLAGLLGVLAGFFLGLFGAGIATGQIDTAPDTLVAFGAFIVIPAILAVVFSALAARASKQHAAGLVAQVDPSQMRYWDGSAWTAHVADSGKASMDPLDVTPASDQEDASPVNVDSLLSDIVEHVDILIGDTSQDERIAQLMSLGPSVIPSIDAAINRVVVTQGGHSAHQYENAGRLCKVIGELGGPSAFPSLSRYADQNSDIWEYQHIRQGAREGLGLLPQTSPDTQDPALPSPSWVIHTKGDFDVILAATGERKIQVIKTIRILTGLTLNEAKHLAENVPKPLLQEISSEDAVAAKAQLEGAGATVEIKARIAQTRMDLPAIEKAREIVGEKYFFGPSEWARYCGSEFHFSDVPAIPWTESELRNRGIDQPHFLFLGISNSEGMALAVPWLYAHPAPTFEQILKWYLEQVRRSAEGTYQTRWYQMPIGAVKGLWNLKYSDQVSRLPAGYEVPTAAERFGANVLFHLLNGDYLDNYLHDARTRTNRDGGLYTLIRIDDEGSVRLVMHDGSDAAVSNFGIAASRKIPSPPLGQ